jgi:hypothetical protein
MDASVVDRIATGERDLRYCLGGALALCGAGAAVAYGLADGDVVTALGGLLFVPAGLLLVGIGLAGGAAARETRGERA